MIHDKIHLISPGCPRPSIALQCRIVAGLKCHLFQLHFQSQTSLCLVTFKKIISDCLIYQSRRAIPVWKATLLKSLVWLDSRPCKNKKNGERYALKCLHNRPRAWREVNLHMRCSGHPHIVSIIDIYENEVQFPADPKPLWVKLVWIWINDI